MSSSTNKRVRNDSSDVSDDGTNGTNDQNGSNTQDKRTNFVSAKSKQKNLQQKRKKQMKKRRAMVPGSPEDVLEKQIEELIGHEKVCEIVEEGKEYDVKFENFPEVTLQVESLNAHGEGMALTPEKDWVVVVPFCLPGETIVARVYSNGRLHSNGDLCEVKSASPKRSSANVKCKYFGRCSGCQYQELDYQEQLVIKKNVIERAYKYYGGQHEFPTVLPTIASPLEYEYRTKLTPHFDIPRTKKDATATTPTSLPVGFNEKGRRAILDIEECPIATKQINEKMVTERERVKRDVAKFKRGATLLLRHSLPVPSRDGDNTEPICITDHKEIVREKVGDKIFEFNAGSFFQNNASILESLTDYVKQEIMECRTTKTETEKYYLVDAYCGSGLFSIVLSDKFDKVSGVEISADSVKYAQHNVELNNIKNTNFIVGDAQHIFEGTIDFDSKNTTVMIDPPRRGSDENFLNQLLTFEPSTIVYVSCNVHTQARDLDYILTKGTKSGHYVVKSIRGADLFPQTHHVESIAVLTFNPNL